MFDSIPDQYKTQEICDIDVSLYPFLVVYCPDKYKTQNMCNKAAADCLGALKFMVCYKLNDWKTSYGFVRRW